MGWDLRHRAVELGLLMVPVLAIVGWLRWSHRDVDFCRRLLSDLSRGRASVERQIAWEQFQAFEEDVGADYRRFPEGKERTDYRREFIRGFAMGFKREGARGGEFTGWRVMKRTPERVHVAVDNRRSGKTLVFVITTAKPTRWVGTQWVEAVAP